MIQLTKVLNVSFEWLTTGIGNKEIEVFLFSEKSTYKDDDRLISITKEQKGILLLIEQPPLDCQQKNKLTLEVVTSFLKKKY